MHSNLIRCSYNLIRCSDKRIKIEINRVSLSNNLIWEFYIEIFLLFSICIIPIWIFRSIICNSTQCVPIFNYFNYFSECWTNGLNAFRLLLVALLSQLSLFLSFYCYFLRSIIVTIVSILLTFTYWLLIRPSPVGHTNPIRYTNQFITTITCKRYITGVMKQKPQSLAVCRNSWITTVAC